MWGTMRTPSQDEGDTAAAPVVREDQDLDDILSDDLDTLLDLNEAPQESIDLTFSQSLDADAPVSSSSNPNDDAALAAIDDSLIIDDDYVPPGLADFVQQANQTLHQQQQNFMLESSIEPVIPESGIEPPRQKVQGQDEEDRQLKAQVLDGLGTTATATTDQQAPLPAFQPPTPAPQRPPPPQQQQQQQQADLLMSPDLLFTPPPNPTHGITDSEAKRGAFEGSTPTTAAAGTASTAKQSLAARMEESTNQPTATTPVGAPVASITPVVQAVVPAQHSPAVVPMQQQLEAAVDLPVAKKNSMHNSVVSSAVVESPERQPAASFDLLGSDTEKPMSTEPAAVEPAEAAFIGDVHDHSETDHVQDLMTAVTVVQPESEIAFAASPVKTATTSPTAAVPPPPQAEPSVRSVFAPAATTPPDVVPEVAKAPLTPAPVSKPVMSTTPVAAPVVPTPVKETPVPTPIAKPVATTPTDPALVPDQLKKTPGAAPLVAPTPVMESVKATPALVAPVPVAVPVTVPAAAPVKTAPAPATKPVKATPVPVAAASVVVVVPVVKTPAPASKPVATTPTLISNVKPVVVVAPVATTPAPARNPVKQTPTPTWIVKPVAPVMTTPAPAPKAVASSPTLNAPVSAPKPAKQAPTPPSNDKPVSSIKVPPNPKPETKQAATGSMSQMFSSVFSRKPVAPAPAPTPSPVPKAIAVSTPPPAVATATNPMPGSLPKLVMTPQSAPKPPPVPASVSVPSPVVASPEPGRKAKAETVATGNKSEKPATTAAATTPLPRKPATSRSSTASKASPTVTPSSARLSRPAATPLQRKSPTTRVTTPVSATKSTPRVSSKVAVDRLSRPRASPSTRSKTESPPVRSKVMTPSSVASSASRLSRPTAAAAARAATSTSKRTPPARKPVIPTRAARVAPITTSSPPARKPKAVSAGSGSRLLQGTAASRARVTEMSPAESAKSRALADDGRAKARERVRQRMLKQQKQDQEKVASVTAPKSARTSKSSIDDGIARARERVRKKQLEKKAAQEKDNRVRANASSIRRASGRMSVGTTRPRVTIPHGPKFATDAKYGEKHMGKKEAPTLAQSGDVMRKGLRGGDKGAPYTRTGKARPTIPHGPKFATTAKYGEKQSVKPEQPSLANSQDSYARHLRDDISVGGSVASKGSRGSLTIPHAPKFATTARYGEGPATPGGASRLDQSLAQSTDILKSGLRDGKSSISTKRRSGPTIPHGPRFHKAAPRELPQSATERDEELMEHYHSHPFRANPVLTHVPGSQRPPTKPKQRRMTAPVPFHFSSEVRSAKAKPAVGSPDKQDADLKEMKHQFRARAMPSFAKPTQSQIASSKARAKPTTTPKPFSRLTDRQIRTEPRDVTSPDDVEMSKKFHARPVPKSTYKPPSPRSNPVSPMAGQSTVGPPKLATMARTEKRNAASEASRRNVDAQVIEKDRQAKLRQRQKHEEAILKAETKTPPPPTKPFVLHSSLRHEAYQKQLAEKHAVEEEAARKKMSFHARSFKSPPAPERIRAEHGPTEPKPFALSCVTRHEAFKHEKQERLVAAEEELRRQTDFKAKPVPKSTYVYKPISPKAGELVDPFSPELQSKQRAQDRKEFDAQAYRERMEKVASQKSQDDRIAAEEKADLEERRSLPAHEGGMIPTAEPVNSVFLK